MRNTGVITKGKVSCLVNCVYAAVNNRSALRNVASPVLLTNSLVSSYVRQSIAEEAHSSNSLI
jgi:hypothetical protein